MKIVDLQTFRELPSNTVFTKYTHCVFDELCIKGVTLENDFCVQDIADSIQFANSEEFADNLFRAADTGESIRFDFECEGRDGLFDKDQLFAVWDDDDVRNLINRLGKCIKQNNQ